MTKELPLYRVRDVANFFDVSTPTVYNWIKAGRLETINWKMGIKPNTMLRISHQSLNAFRAEDKVKQQAKKARVFLRKFTEEADDSDLISVMKHAEKRKKNSTVFQF